MKRCKNITFALMPFIIAAQQIQQTKASEQESANNPHSWYQRYTDYPPYCSTPYQMRQRQIPPLYISNTTNAGATRLVHVTSVLHHGARTILGPETTGSCWDGYWESSETGVWDCNLTTYLATPSKRRIFEEEEDTDMGLSDSMFLYNLDFDALKKPLSNILNGTCQEGQLILQGYDQQVENGKMLRNAYMYDESASEDADHDERMRLFSVSRSGATAPPWDNDSHLLHVRSGDSQPTMMSGQLLMRGLFERELEEYRSKDEYGFSAFPSIRVHTADDTMDILGGFHKNCPKLDALKRQSFSATEYQEFYNTIESQQVRNFMESQLSDDNGLFDCLMTTICTDRPLPEQFGDYEEDKSTWFNRILTYHTRNHSFPLLYDDAEYSKLSIGPLWAEILDHIKPIVDGVDEDDRKQPPSKLAVYSGYDSTIMFLLASLGGKVWDGLVWPPYASMLLIEIHELLDDNRDKTIFETNSAFRLVYNGRVLTSQVAGCPEDSELCDAKYLMERVEPIAIRKVDCVDLTQESVDAVEVAKSMVSTTAGVLLVLFVIGVGAFFGGVAVFVHLTGSLPDKLKKKKKKKPQSAIGRGALVSEQLEMPMSVASSSFVDPHEDLNEDPVLT